MSNSSNHSIIRAHAHANLLGWVKMALFTAYAAGSLIVCAGALLFACMVFRGESATADPITAAIPDTASSR